VKISEIIVVEGRDDTQAVKRAVECETIETHGFGIRESVWQSLDRAYKSRGLIIFTDPDHAGDTIRRKIKERYPDCREAFLPRPKADKDGDIGVENAAPEDIREALMKVRPSSEEVDGKGGEDQITWEMITSAGLTGAPDSRARREAVAEKLGISYGNAKAMLSHMNAFGITSGEFNEAVRAIDNKADKK
jgi:ribonuclease M5